MELFEEMSNLSSLQIIWRSIKFSKWCQRKFLLVSLTLILSFLGLFAEDDHLLGILAHKPKDSISLLKQIMSMYTLYKFLLVVISYHFYLLTASLFIFNVASLYLSHPIPSKATLIALPRIYIKHLITSMYLLPLRILNQVILHWVLRLIEYITPDTQEIWSIALFIIITTAYHAVFYLFHLYIMSLWQLTGVIVVLEPNIWGFAAIRKSNQLLRGKIITGLSLSSYYLLGSGIFGLIFYVFDTFSLGILLKVLLLVVGAIVLVGVNCIGLLVQNLFYYVCKDHHNQVIDKPALLFHLERKKAEDNSQEQ